VRDVLILLIVLLVVVMTVPAMGSVRAAEWVKVNDGAYLAAWVQQGVIAYVPAETRLSPPPPNEDAEKSTGQQVFEGQGTLAIRDMEGPPSAREVDRDNRRPFIYRTTGSGSLPATGLTELPGGWSLELGGTCRYLRDTLDRLDRLAVAPSGQMYCGVDTFGHVKVRGLHGETITLPGLPSSILDSICGIAWSSDSTAVYLAHPTGHGTEIWLAPIEGRASLLQVVPQFDGFSGTTPAGVLVYQYGTALREVTPTGTRTLLNLAPEDVPWAISPDARYVLWLDRTVSLSSLESGKVLTLDMPKGYELCPPFGWPGPTSSEIAVYACGRDPSDTLLLLYTETSPEHFDLTTMTLPPTKDACFDYTVDPVVVGPGVVSVVVTDRAAFCIGNAVNSETWLVYLNGTGGR